MTASEVAALITAGLPGAHVRVLSEDDVHFEAVVVAREFAGKRSLARHQLVYAALGPRMGREIHALSLKAFTPDEWARESGPAGA
jgi:acid stress-induced BolA-like protein IbaG/YrbA